MRKVLAGMLAAAVLVSVCSATAIVSARCGHHGGAAGSRVRQETFCHFTDTDGDGICDSCQFVWDADQDGGCDYRTLGCDTDQDGVCDHCLLGRDADEDGICDSCLFGCDADRDGVCDHSAYCGGGYGSGDYGVSGCGTGNGYRRGHHCR